MSEFQEAYRRGERNLAKRVREQDAEIERLRGDVEGYAKTIRVLRAALKTALERIEELEDVSHNAYGPDA